MGRKNLRRRLRYTAIDSLFQQLTIISPPSDITPYHGAEVTTAAQLQHEVEVPIVLRRAGGGR